MKCHILPFGMTSILPTPLGRVNTCFVRTLWVEARLIRTLLGMFRADHHRKHEKLP